MNTRRVVEKAIGEKRTGEPLDDPNIGKNPAAVVLGRLEEARLAREGTLCRDSMPESERTWLRANRPEAAIHWSLLTSLTAGQLPYAAH